MLAAEHGPAASRPDAVAAVTARILSETEGQPATWPGLDMIEPPYLSGDDFDRFITEEIVWRRIEAWITRRWATRSVVYIAEGPGWWQPRLEPFTLTTTERWQANAWTACTLDATPLGGLELPGCGPYRITGTAGDDGAVPTDAHEAANRLHMYVRGIGRSAWNETATYQHADSQAVASWAGKAIHLSGAADLLRPYRRLGAS